MLKMPRGGHHVSPDQEMQSVSESTPHLKIPVARELVRKLGVAAARSI